MVPPLWPITNRSLETVVKEDEEESKEFSLILTIEVDNREKKKEGTGTRYNQEFPLKFNRKNNQSTVRTDSRCLVDIYILRPKNRDLSLSS